MENDSQDLVDVEMKELKEPFLPLFCETNLKQMGYNFKAKYK
jgi:hypothetical protein